MKSSKLVPWNWFLRDAAETGRASHTRGCQAVLAPVTPLSMELDRLFDSFFGACFPQERTRPGQSLAEATFRPDLDISGDNRQYTVSVELPGVSEQDLHVELEDNTLRISGEKRYARDSEKDCTPGGEGCERGKSFFRLERSYGSFQRLLELPEDVDVEGITAVHKDGVLTISMPRKAVIPQSARRIAVNKG